MRALQIGLGKYVSKVVNGSLNLKACVGRLLCKLRIPFSTDNNCGQAAIGRKVNIFV